MRENEDNPIEMIKNGYINLNANGIEKKKWVLINIPSKLKFNVQIFKMSITWDGVISYLKIFYKNI